MAMDRNLLMETVGKILTCIGGGLCLIFHTTFIGGGYSRLDPLAHGCLMMFGIALVFTGECCLLLVKYDDQHRLVRKQKTEFILHNLTGAMFLLSLKSFINGIAYAKGEVIPKPNDALAVIETLFMIAYFLAKIYNVIKIIIRLMCGRRGEEEEEERAESRRGLIDTCLKLCRPRGEYVVPPNIAQEST